MHAQSNMKHDEISDLLEQHLAKFAGQITRYVDERAESFEARLDTRLDRIEIAIDNLASRAATEEQERAAIIVEQHRHRQWVHQLAKETRVKLVSE